MLELEWRTLHRQRVPDLIGALTELIASGDRVIHIGTDAQKVDRRIDFVTCVVVLTPGKGGRVFYTRIRKSRRDVKTLRQKLFAEAWLSVETAMEIEPHLPEELPIVVHLDVNPDRRWASSRHINEVVGLVMGQGFEVLFKPDAWAASHTADHVVKNKHHVTSASAQRAAPSARAKARAPAQVTAAATDPASESTPDTVDPVSPADEPPR